jgi:hypothetical protein
MLPSCASLRFFVTYSVYAGNFVDLVQQADYNKYYDTVGPQSGAQMARYSEFSLKSIRAAAAEGRSILSMFPYDAINNARDVLAQY